MLDPDDLGRLTALAQQTLTELAAEVCEQGGVDPAEVYEVALAGNATMTHLALGIDPEPLGVAPFIMATRLCPRCSPPTWACACTRGPARWCSPPFGAYVGGDITAGLLASGMDRDARTRLFMDIGTNCEIVLGNRRLAAGHRRAGRAGVRGGGDPVRDARRRRRDRGGHDDPGRAGARRSSGTPSRPGCAARAWWTRSTGLVRLGLLDPSGRFVTARTQATALAPGLAGRLTRLGEERVFVLHWLGEPGDVGAVGLPVPAGRPGAPVRQGGHRHRLARSCWRRPGWPPGDIQQVLLAGSFGSYLSPANAIRLGLVPELGVLRVVSAGNVAGEGAKMALLSRARARRRRWRCWRR